MIRFFSESGNEEEVCLQVVSDELSFVSVLVKPAGGSASWKSDFQYWDILQWSGLLGTRF